MLNVSIWTTSRRVDPNVVIRLFTLAEIEENLPNLRVYFDTARPSTFRLVEYDQVAEEINLSHL